MRGIFVLLLSSALSACHTYVAAPPPLSPGHSVRVTLTAEGAVRLAQITGSPRTAVEGAVIGDDARRVSLQVPIRGVVPELQRSPKVAGTLQIATSDIVSVERQAFSAFRTVAAALGVAAIFTTAIVVADGGGSTGDGDPGGGRTAFVPSAQHVTLIRIPLGRR